MSARGATLQNFRPVPDRSRSLASRRLVLALLLGVAAAQTGCITRQINETIYDDGKTEAILRSEKRGTQVVPLGLDQPIDIASVRLAHILSRIDLRPGDGGDRQPAIPLENLYDIAEALSLGLKQATPDQRVAIQSIRHGKSLFVFDRQYLTSLLAYMKNDVLYIQISRSDWEIPKARQRNSPGASLPQTHIGEHPLDFRLVVDPGMVLADAQSVAVQWRDPIFRKPTRTRVTPSGKIVRRIVLMESPMEDTSDVSQPMVSPELSSDQLRALADLEDARKTGKISETEYFKRRGAVLRGEAP